MGRNSPKAGGVGSWGIFEWLFTLFAALLAAIGTRLWTMGGRIAAMEAHQKDTDRRLDAVAESITKINDLLLEQTGDLKKVLESHADLHNMTANLASLSQVLRDHGGEIETVRKDISELRGEVLGVLNKVLDNTVSKPELSAEIKVIESRFELIRKELDHVGP